MRGCMCVCVGMCVQVCVCLCQKNRIFHFKLHAGIQRQMASSRCVLVCVECAYMCVCVCVCIKKTFVRLCC